MARLGAISVAADLITLFCASRESVFVIQDMCTSKKPDAWKAAVVVEPVAGHDTGTMYSRKTKSAAVAIRRINTECKSYIDLITLYG